LVVAGTIFFEGALVILLAPVAGIMIDRLPRKAVLIGLDLVRAMLVLALLLTTELWQIYTIVPLLTVAATFFNPAGSATLPTLLDKQELLAANSVSWSTGRFVQILGSAMALGGYPGGWPRDRHCFQRCHFFGLRSLAPDPTCTTRLPDRGTRLARVPQRRP
jgi:MFS family permease